MTAPTDQSFVRGLDETDADFRKRILGSTDPQSAIARLRATLPSIKRGLVAAGLGAAHGCGDVTDPTYLEAATAFAADIETLTQVGWAFAYDPGVMADSFAFSCMEAGEQGPYWFPVYARVPS